MSFLPTTRDEMLEQGYEQVDFVYVSGDAYVDHPSFGCAIITRTLQAYGYSCAVLAQPDWHKDEEFLQFGKPRLGFLVSAGNIDSMVNHYSVNKRRRDKDAYSDQGIMGKRPDRPTIVYTQILKRLFPDIPILIGGIEASLRRLAHYDYWDDKVRRSILIDSQADLLMFGMGENTIIEVAEALDGGLNVKDICYIRGTVWKTKSIESIIDDYILLPDYETICHDKYAYARSFMIQYENQDAIQSKILIEPYDGWYVVCNQPPLPLTQEQMDFTYSLPYERTFHPKYTYVPAIEEVQFSITSNRGCFGSCAFCAITSHQGRVISSRSTQSVVEEAKKIIEMPNFKGYIHDLGGPSANFSRPACDKQTTLGACAKRQCLWPKPCPNLKVDHTHYVEMLDAIRELPKVKKVFIRSGIRYDYLMYDKDETFFDRLIQYHISGQLKVAPEHVSAAVLDKMGKPRKELYLKFVDKYYEKNKQWGMKQYLVPYLMSSHPGCELKDAIELACYLKKIHHIPKQVQDFYPTPGTLATCMYYTGLDPRNMKPVYVAKTFEEKLEQRALMQYSYPKNYDIVYRALKKACRDDLIGSGPKCLIPAKRPYQKHKKERTKKRDVR
ncbi:YgiQ family radical SAM protein [Faecalicoccus acidiformans]|uniref:YgiQ family radical SAM protein n=1 Tax=Faecalicoccus acidiformans TaxID=915173 RepID=A0ABS2FRX8_9FIRM|nr:YgiQ family radical SAM protein [Faecalicoccus acidiformans]MBM6832101.1 YgiQ family radical SAM protein [Faecalicoccus acidiformans]MDM8204366.1 YgiQ family radical SAM protein [Faecalicoccus acidiformans]